MDSANGSGGEGGPVSLHGTETARPKPMRQRVGTDTGFKAPDRATHPCR